MDFPRTDVVSIEQHVQKKCSKNLLLSIEHREVRRYRLISSVFRLLIRCSHQYAGSMLLGDCQREEVRHGRNDMFNILN